MNSKLESLYQDLKSLSKELWQRDKSKWNRTNPFVESFGHWKEKGEFLFGKDKNITVYDTCSLSGDVQVGENSWIGPYTALDGTAGIKIGKNCSISAGVNILTHDSVKWALSGGKAKYEYEKVEIGDNCFVGTNVIILKGVQIGNQCVIGANAVVTKSIPDNSIAVGVPAKVIGKTIVTDGEVEFEYF